MLPRIILHILTTESLRNQKTVNNRKRQAQTEPEFYLTDVLHGWVISIWRYHRCYTCPTTLCTVLVVLIKATNS